LRGKIKDLEELKELAEESEDQNDGILKKLRADLCASPLISYNSIRSHNGHLDHLDARQVEILDRDATVTNLHKIVQESTTRTEHLESYISQLRQVHHSNHPTATPNQPTNQSINQSSYRVFSPP